MSWTIEYFKQAEKDLDNLDHSQQLQVAKAIRKVSVNPLPIAEGGFGKPLGNKNNQNLTGCLKIKLKAQGLRVVYGLVREAKIMKIVVISIRADDTVYKTATERLKK